MHWINEDNIFIFICQISYTVGTYLMKLSFTCTLLRLIQTRLQYAVLLVLMITGAIITTATIIQAVLYCKQLPTTGTSSATPTQKATATSTRRARS